MSKDKRIIEINGIKMEVDLRTAKTIEHYAVGDRVKVLKKTYSSNYDSHLGVIVGFDDFKESPTMVIAILDAQYNKAEIKFEYFNKHSEDIQIAPVNEWDIPYTKGDIVEKLNQAIEKAKDEVKKAESQRDAFVKMFGKYFEKSDSNK